MSDMYDRFKFRYMSDMYDRFKFRYWDKRTEPHELREGDEYSDWYEMSLYHERIVIMQCTGLKDKNGTLIFEGDIVRGDYFKGSWTVFFWEGCFTLKPYSSATMANYNCPKSMEIIGNIHENPELLKEN